PPRGGCSRPHFGWERFRRPKKLCPCFPFRPGVAAPPRRPSILAIRSRWPVHVPTRDTESSALNTGVETRVANAAEYKSAFMWGLHASIFEESHSRCEEGVTSVPVRRGVPGCGRTRRRPDGPHPTPDPPPIAPAAHSPTFAHL